MPFYGEQGTYPAIFEYIQQLQVVGKSFVTLAFSHSRSRLHNDVKYTTWMARNYIKNSKSLEQFYMSLVLSRWTSSIITEWKSHFIINSTFNRTWTTTKLINNNKNIFHPYRNIFISASFFWFNINRSLFILPLCCFCVYSERKRLPCVVRHLWIQFIQSERRAMSANSENACGRNKIQRVFVLLWRRRRCKT